MKYILEMYKSSFGIGQTKCHDYRVTLISGYHGIRHVFRKLNICHDHVLITVNILCSKRNKSEPVKKISYKIGRFVYIIKRW